MILVRFSFCAVLALTLSYVTTASVRAEPPDFPDFKAKFVKPPAKGGARAPLVQVTPVTVQPKAPAAPDAPASSGAVGRYGWFWEGVETALPAQGGERARVALDRLTKAPAGQAVAAPRLAEMQKLAATHGSDLLRASIGTEVSPALALAVLAVESAGRVDAVSGAGAEGLMQLMPATAERFGVSDTMNAAQNIAGGVKYLNLLMRKFGGDAVLALAGYNAGENAVTEHGGVPPFAETRDYVPKVLAAYQVARALCKTPPQLVSDGCVFAQPKAP